MSAWTTEDPEVLTGSGTAHMPSGNNPAVASFTATFSGSLTATVDVAAPVLFEVFDTDGDLIQDDTDGTLGLILQNGDTVQIHITADGILTDGGTLTWTFAARPSAVMQVSLDTPEISITPGGLAVNLSNGVSGDEVTFSFLGPTEVADFETVTLDEFGARPESAIPLPALQAGAYVLRAESLRSGTTDVDFTVLEDPLDAGTHETVDPTPPTLSVQRWTFYDPRNPEDTWTLQRNPKSWSTMLPPNVFTETPTVAPDGQTLTYEAGSRPWRMEFQGFIDNEDEYNRFVFWSSLRRRLWLIDHRGRTWLLTIEEFDARALIKPGLPWAHDYTAKTVIFKQGTD